MIEIRDTRPSEIALAASLQARAFGPPTGDAIGELVLEIFRDPTARPFWSILARQGGQPVGHLAGTGARLLSDNTPSGQLGALAGGPNGSSAGPNGSPVGPNGSSTGPNGSSAGPAGDAPAVTLALLGPLSVVAEARRQGVGTALVHAWLDRLRAASIDLALVLGPADYYARFGFAPATPYGLLPPYHDPAYHADAWQALELRPGALPAARGTVECVRPFHEERLWRA